jgi:CRP-like cAMP-binding protein
LPGRESPDALKALAVIKRCHRGQEICSEDGAAEYWYRVVSGVARRCTVRPDGRRQIVDLLLPGDCFGCADRAEHGFAIEAITDDTVMACYPRRRLEALAASDTRIDRGLREMALDAISRLEGQILLLGEITALEKVGAFLCYIAQRSPGATAEWIVLPMSRYDIADYLAISVETVSRALARLRHDGVIALSGTRRVRILDRAALDVRIGESRRH